MNYQHAFSLIELLIALAILAILISFGYPSYTQHMVKAKRAEASITLMQFAGEIEQLHLQNNSYESGALPPTPQSLKPFYQFNIDNLSENTFTLYAVPIAQQKKLDRHCGILSINEKGKKQISGNGKIEECW